MSFSKEIFTGKQSIIVPGVMDSQSTQSVRQGGFEAAYLNGYDVVKSQLGKTNEGLISPSEMSVVIRHVKENTTFPLIVDAQSGFGNQLTTYFVVQDFERSGADGVVINDQIFPSHTNDDEVDIIDFSDFVAKLKATKDVFEDPTTVLFAELDGVQTYGVDGLAKRIAYLEKEAVADVILVGHLGKNQFDEIDSLAETQQIGAVFNEEDENYFVDNHFSPIFRTGVISKARMEAEQRIFQTEVEAN